MAYTRNNCTKSLQNAHVILILMIYKKPDGTLASKSLPALKGHKTRSSDKGPEVEGGQGLASCPSWLVARVKSLEAGGWGGNGRVPTAAQNPADSASWDRSACCQRLALKSSVTVTPNWLMPDVVVCIFFEGKYKPFSLKTDQQLMFNLHV